METRFHVEMAAQPDDSTCGPTCLQGIYEYWGDRLPLAQLIGEVRHLEEGGTLAVLLAHHALRRGYRVTIYPYNLQWLDPSWFELSRPQLVAKLKSQFERATDRKLRLSCNAYREFLELGGELRFADLSARLVSEILGRGVPILTGLSSTWLYRAAREDPKTWQEDDVAGEPVGHFVVLCGYDRTRRTVLVADPFRDNPIRSEPTYEISVDRVLNAILLGILTYDANLLLVEPRKEVAV
jgi:hypothetical protein